MAVVIGSYVLLRLLFTPIGAIVMGILVIAFIAFFLKICYHVLRWMIHMLTPDKEG